MFIKNFVPSKFCVCSVGLGRLSEGWWVAWQRFTRQHFIAVPTDTMLSAAAFPDLTTPVSCHMSSRCRELLYCSTRQYLLHLAPGQDSSLWQHGQGEGDFLSSDLHFIREFHEMLFSQRFTVYSVVTVIEVTGDS